MKMAAIVVSGLGVLALLLAILERVAGFQMMNVYPGALVRFAEALFLLALVIMAYGKCYCCCKEEAKPQP